MSAKVEVLSFGGGVQTTALAILVVRGEVDCDAIVFADTGGERPETYEHIARFGSWLEARGRCLTTVRAEGEDLYGYVWNRSAVIPVRIGENEGLGHRQCTRQWKIEPVLRHARTLGGAEIVMQLGISYDEIHRMKESPDKGVTRRWPLIERRLNREDCRRIILDAGLPEPPKSACYYCPLLPAMHFRRLAVETPRLFGKAAALEDRINEVHRLGKKPAYLTPYGRPLRTLDVGQLTLMSGNEEAECEGTCFV